MEERLIIRLLESFMDEHGLYDKAGRVYGNRALGFGVLFQSSIEETRYDYNDDFYVCLFCYCH
jgi:hypothetical protein